MLPVNELQSNNHIIGEFSNHTKLHEHDFKLIRTEKEQTSIICLTCRSIYCEKCGKLLTIIDQNYMQNNIYN